MVKYTETFKIEIAERYLAGRDERSLTKEFGIAHEHEWTEGLIARPKEHAPMTKRKKKDTK